MKDRRMDRFVVLPFSVGCVSQSSVAVSENQPRRAQAEAASIPQSSNTFPIESYFFQWIELLLVLYNNLYDTSMNLCEGERPCSAKSRGPFNLPLVFPRSNLSAGFQKMVKSFRSFSHLFVFDGKDDDEEMEMQIGFPTDVQHVGHIGWDGFSTMSTTLKSWDRGPDQFLSLPSASFSLKQFEMAMAAQAGVAPPPAHPSPPPHGPHGALPQ